VLEREGRRNQFVERLTGPLAPEAAYLAGAPIALCCAALFNQLWGLSFFLFSLGLFLGMFFRNPNRKIPEGKNLVVSPADGKVIEINEIQLPDGSEGIRIGIFLSIFDVHINRAPVEGRVLAITRSGSAFKAAFNNEAPARNVQLSMKMEAPGGQLVWVVQITGLIARRIVCHAKEDVYLEKGDRYGLIRFGSRTDVLLPKASKVLVELRQQVRGGKTVIGQLAEVPQDA
tara:strand:- start:287 stop:976 length:690 start_codon:yes stop_codon:yes gene_type:complete